MDWLKVIVEKFFGFVAPVISGAVVLLLFGIHHPTWATTVRDITYLGYRTKLTLVVGAAFVGGFTVVTAVVVLFSFIEGVLGEVLQKWLLGEKQENPPWRNKAWRSLVKKYLGDAAPEDLDLVSDNVLAFQIERANLISDPLERGKAIAAANQAKGKAQVVEHYWDPGGILCTMIFCRPKTLCHS